MSETKFNPCVNCGDRGRALVKLLEAAEAVVTGIDCVSFGAWRDDCADCPITKLKTAVEKAKGGKK